MKKIFLLLVIFLCVSCANKNTYLCSYRIFDIDRFSLIRLRILGPYSNPLSYEISRDAPHVLTITEFEEKNCRYWAHILHRKSYTLTDSEFNEIIILLNSALVASPMSNTKGLDGEEWMLESSVYNFTATTHWSPDVESEKRGLVGLVKLKEYFGKFE